MKTGELIGCFYPNKCAACGEIIGDDKYLCDFCESHIDNIDFEKWCSKCGFEKDNCRCKFREYRFKGIVAAYKNDGPAKVAYYAYKMARRGSLADFFAQKTVSAVKRVFGDMKFDAVFCVPTAKRSLIKRGFDHNKLISRRIADMLNIKFYDGVLKSRHFVPMQHKSSYRQRLKNVRGKYYTVGKLNIKRALLFDDIYTTGATIDECTKELMFAGVNEIYCVSVLSNSFTRKENGEKKYVNRYRNRFGLLQNCNIFGFENRF